MCAIKANGAREGLMSREVSATGHRIRRPGSGRRHGSAKGYLMID